MNVKKRQVIAVAFLAALLVFGSTRFLLLKAGYRDEEASLKERVKEYEQQLAAILTEHGINANDFSITTRFFIYPEFYVYGDPVGLQKTTVKFIDKSGKEHVLSETKKGWYHDGTWTGVLPSRLNYKSLEDQLRDAVSSS